MGACGKRGHDDSASSPETASQAAVPAARTKRPAAHVEHVRTQGYAITVRYPHLPHHNAPLAKAMHSFGQQHRDAFVEHMQHSHLPPLTGHYPRELSLSFSLHARTPDFTSVLGQGERYTGGPHAKPITVSFTEDRNAKRLITLNDLLADPRQGLQAIARIARRQLYLRLHGQTHGHDRRLDRGTRPRASNYDVFTIDGHGRTARGLTIIFPPRQVAGYAAGPQPVHISAEDLLPYLKSDYRPAFGGHDQDVADTRGGA